MREPCCSSFGFRSLLVICCLWVIAYADNNQNDDEWIDPYDMLNYDPTTKRMRKPTEAARYTNVPTKRREFSPDSDLSQCPEVSECTNELAVLQKEIDEHKKRGMSPQQPTCLPVFKRFLSKLLKGAEKLGLPTDAKPVRHYDAEVKLTRQAVAEFQRLLKEDQDWTTGAMDEALSQVLVNFKNHDPEAWKWRFEDTFYVEVDTVMKILLCVLIVTAVIGTELWSVVSWFIQFKRMFAVCFFISLIWNWFHLYMLEFAEHQKNVVQLERVNDKCTGVKQIDWKDSFSEWYRRTWTLQDDPCKKYYEVLLVNPILLVPPTKAITVTITSFITDPLKHIGQGISEFLRALLKDLPVTLQIPVLLLIAGAIFVFMYGSAHAAIQHALPWPRFGRRRDPPPPAVGYPQAPQLREHEDWAGGDAPQPLPVPREGNGLNHLRNRVNQGFRERDANANANVPQPSREEMRTPQPRDRDNQSMDCQNSFVGRPAEAQAVRVETLRSTQNISGEDNVDCQQGEEQNPGVEGGEEPKVDEVPKKDEEKSPSTKDKTEPKDAQTADRRDDLPTGTDPAQQIGVKTLGADDGNNFKYRDTKWLWTAKNSIKLQVQEPSADVETTIPGDKQYSSFRTPVQETGQ